METKIHTHTTECQIQCPIDIKYPSSGERCRALHPTLAYLPCQHAESVVPVWCTKFTRNGRHDGQHTGFGEYLRLVHW